MHQPSPMALQPDQVTSKAQPPRTQDFCSQFLVPSRVPSPRTPLVPGMRFNSNPSAVDENTYYHAFVATSTPAA